MKTNRIFCVGKILAILIGVLGVVHNIATFSPLIQDGLKCVEQDVLQAMVYMSLICGTSLILCGILLLVLLEKTKKTPSLTIPLLIIGTFLALNGILSVVCMSDNPFAWAAFVLNLSTFMVTLTIAYNFKK